MANLDLSRLPRGQIEWAAFVDSLSGLDDREERYYLELKSDVDLNSDAGRAKVAKFILGAANRMPDKAAKRLGGYGLMILGMSKGGTSGIPFFEAKDLAATVKKYVGADGPVWDFERIPVGNGRDVIVIVVDPPKWGDSVWTCLKDGHGGLTDGGIYVRRDGETSAAKGDEIRQLLERAARMLPGAELDVEIVGAAYRYKVDDAAMLRYLSREKRKLELAFLRATRSETEGLGLFPQAKIARLASFADPESRSHTEYDDEIARWIARVEQAWGKFTGDAAPAILPAAQVCVRNLSRTYLEDVEIRVHLDGEVAASWRESRNGLMERLPKPPREWGPKPRLDSSRWVRGTQPYIPQTVTPSSKGHDVSFRNGGSVDLTVKISELRPEASLDLDDDELVLVVTDPALARVNGTWRATVRGHHDVYDGNLSVPVEERNLTESIHDLLDPPNAR